MLRSEVVQGDVREVLADIAAGSIQCVVTSPPYWGLRDYGVDGQLGLEPTPEEYIESMVVVFRAVRRVLRDDGTLWLNMGDSYNAQQGAGYLGNVPADAGVVRPSGLPPKNLLGMPWRLAFALQADGWYLRSDIIWAKPNPMPESCTDRPTKSHEYLFMLTKRSTYFWDADAVREPAEYGRREQPANMYARCGVKAEHVPGVTKGGDPSAGRNIRTVWTIPTQPYPDAHFATFPEKLVEPCVRAGTSEKGCCPECGAGWVRVVEKERVATRPGKDSKTRVPTGWARDGEHAAVAWNRPREEVGNRDPGRHVTEVTTTGWRPGCKCAVLDGEPEDQEDIDYHAPVPCVVLDPFVGSGTTGVVCARENRAFVGIELNAEYVEMARGRIGKAMRLADDARRQGVFDYGL